MGNEERYIKGQEPIIISNCCGVEFGEETDICPKCGEHADGIERS